MALITLEQLLDSPTEAQALQVVLDVADSLGFPVTAWQSGNPGLTIAKMLARVYFDTSKAIAAVARAAYRATARDEWLDLVIESQYDEPRRGSTFTQVREVLTCSATAGPHTIAIGDLWFATASGLLYTNIEGDTLATGGELALTFQAESPGAKYNVGNGAITRMRTPLTGVTTTNAGISGASSIVQNGTDAECDDDYAARAPLKWGTISAQPPVGAIEFWAKKASAEVVQVAVDESEATQLADGGGAVRVYLAGEAGAVGSPVIAAVDAYLQARRAPGSVITTLSVTNLVITITGEVFVLASQLVTAQAKVEAQLDAFFRALIIGGPILPGETVGKVYLDAIEGQIAIALGTAFVDSNITAPTSDTALAEYEKAIGSYALTYTAA